MSVVSHIYRFVNIVIPIADGRYTRAMAFTTRCTFRICALVAFCGVVVGSVLYSFPSILALSVENQSAVGHEQFPVTVDPKNKVIVENAQVNMFLESAGSPLQAAVGNVENALWNIFAWVALTIAAAPWYQNIAAVDGRFVAIEPGMRKEQVASAFANALAWNSTQKLEFMTAAAHAPLPLPEGSFSPGVYSLALGTTPTMAQHMVNDRFYKDVLSHYGPETINIVPLDHALTIASLIEREAGGADDRRIISGIIWNRLFIDMNLQIDATLQYAKANSRATGSWWPRVLPRDRFRPSPYNTYLHSGLPPTPIANPSVAAVVAALNPRNTSCLFYFHDKVRQFHCTATYAEHVALLKKYYGRGK